MLPGREHSTKRCRLQVLKARGRAMAICSMQVEHSLDMTLLFISTAFQLMAMIKHGG